MTPERRMAIWAIYGKQSKPHMSLFLVPPAVGALQVPFVFSEWYEIVIRLVS